jgi:hypothetical protein
MNWKILSGSRALSGSQAPQQLSRMEADDPSRRVVLRSALAAGCSLLLPASLLGCSKDEADTAGTAGTQPPPAPSPEMAAPSTPSPMTPSTPAAPAKMSQASVQYQTEPKAGKACADCIHFISESNTCKQVEGDISPTGWCILWAQKA